MGKGGGGSQMSESRSYSSQLPEYAQAYYEPLIREAEMLAYGADYPLYAGPRIAEFSPEELAAFEMRRRLSEQPDPYQIGAAESLMNVGDMLSAGHTPFSTRQWQSGYTPRPSFDAGDVQSDYMGQDFGYFDPSGQHAISAGAAPEMLSAGPRAMQGKGISGMMGRRGPGMMGRRGPGMMGGQRPGMRGGQRPGMMGGHGSGIMGGQGPGMMGRPASSQVPQGASYEQYMNPYTDQVTQREKDTATEEYERQRNRNQAQLIASGAKGGYREHLDDAMGGAMHQEVLAGISGKGQQRSFEMAQAQQARDRQSQMDFQRMGMEASRMNQDAFMRAKELGDASTMRGSEMYMQEQLANQQQYGRSMELQDAAQARASEMQLNAMLDYERRNLQSQELGYRGWTDTMDRYQGLAGASAEMGQLSDANYMRRMSELERAGLTQREMAQKIMDQNREDFMRQSLYPQQQMNWLMGLLGGVPVTPEQTYVSQGPTAGIASQLLGLGVGLGGLDKFLG
jgi:hypothetical protein